MDKDSGLLHKLDQLGAAPAAAMRVLEGATGATIEGELNIQMGHCLKWGIPPKNNKHGENDYQRIYFLGILFSDKWKVELKY